MKIYQRAPFEGRGKKLTTAKNLNLEGEPTELKINHQRWTRTANKQFYGKFISFFLGFMEKEVSEIINFQENILCKHCKA